MTEEDGDLRPVVNHVKLEALLGRIPRHVMDVSLGSESLDSRYEEDFRVLVDQAQAASDAICTKLETQCWELKALEEAGLKDRVRYLTAIGCIAAAVNGRLEYDQEVEWLPLLRTVHTVVAQWRNEATYDLSNLLGPLELLTRTGRSREKILGSWIWLNLEDQGQSRFLTWVKSSMRFSTGYGRAILQRFGAEWWALELGQEPTDAAASVSREEARRITRRYLREHRVPSATGEIRAVISVDESSSVRLNVYGYSEDFWRQHWITYVEQEGVALRESVIIAVHQETGDIGYVGGAGDEG